MHNRLNCYISKLQILNLNQYGFHKNHSPHLAIIDMCNNITISLDDGKTVIGIFIDLSKAFDIVNRNILLDKLQYCGIHSIALQWFKSYLTSKTQYVNLDNINATKNLITFGVPQGPILGTMPFYYIIMIFLIVPNYYICVLFADEGFITPTLGRPE